MAAVIGAIDMRVSGLAALVAICNYIIRNPLSQPVVKNKIFSDKLTLFPLFIYIPGIVNNTAFQVKYMIKPVV